MFLFLSSGGRGSTPRRVWWTGSPSIPFCCCLSGLASVCCLAPLHYPTGGRPLPENIKKTYLTRYLATRNFYLCGRISLWGTGFGECRCGLLRRVQSIVTTCSRFWSWLLVFALFGSHFAEDKLLVLGPWSFQAWIFCKSYFFIVFSGSPVLFSALPIWA